MDVTGWSQNLSVEVGGCGVINHAGAAALRLLADRTGLTMGLSRALARRGFTPVHDRGRVLADLAILRDQAELYGPVASDPTLWRPGRDRSGAATENCAGAGHDPRACVVTHRSTSWQDPAVAGGRPRPGQDDRDPDGRLAGDRPLATRNSRPEHIRARGPPSLDGLV